jgi:hypothetical protein
MKRIGLAFPLIFAASANAGQGPSSDHQEPSCLAARFIEKTTTLFNGVRIPRQFEGTLFACSLDEIQWELRESKVKVPENDRTLILQQSTFSVVGHPSGRCSSSNRRLNKDFLQLYLIPLRLITTSPEQILSVGRDLVHRFDLQVGPYHRIDLEYRDRSEIPARIIANGADAALTIFEIKEVPKQLIQVPSTCRK